MKTYNAIVADKNGKIVEICIANGESVFEDDVYLNCNKQMEEILSNLYDLCAFSGMSWQVVLMWVIAFILLYLGIKKEYEPLLLVPIAFGLLLANFPGGGMGIVPAEEIVLEGERYKNLFEIANEYGIMNYLYYSLIKTGLLPPIIFMGVGAMTDFGPMLRNLKLSLFGAAAKSVFSPF